MNIIPSYPPVFQNTETIVRTIFNSVISFFVDTYSSKTHRYDNKNIRGNFQNWKTIIIRTKFSNSIWRHSK